MNGFTQRALSRRRFLQFTGLTAGAALLAACPAGAAAPGAAPSRGRGGGPRR